MDILKTLQPGKNGTKRFVRKYQDKLVAVRYRKSSNKDKVYTTVELIVDEREYKTNVNLEACNAIRNKTLMPLRIGYDELGLREEVKRAGGRWYPADKVWLLEYFKVVELDLRDRIVEKDMSKYGHDEIIFR